MNGRKIRTQGSKGRENLTRLAVSAALLTLTACGGGGNSEDDAAVDLSNLQDLPPSIGAATDGTLTAATDVAETAAGDTVSVSILSNDIVSQGVQLQLLGQPANGFAELLDNGELLYTADADFEGTDSVDYILVAADGTQSTGTVYIAVACADCLISGSPVLATSDPNGTPYCANDNSDPDGDGYGWEGNESCTVPPVGAALPKLEARSDSVTLTAGTSTAVSAMLNDSIADRDTVEFSIDTHPQNGVIEAADSGVVVYTAPDSFQGTDTLLYSLTDLDGNSSVANIEFNVICPSCVSYEGLRLSWPANPAGEDVEGYKVFFGPDENFFTSDELIQVQASDFTGSAPNTVFDLANDLNISGSEGGCFRVTAVRGSEESEPSAPICFTLG